MVMEILIYISAFIACFAISFYVISYLYDPDKKPKEIPKGKLPKVSIIIPAWNEEKGIGKTILSLQKIDYPKDKLEIIIVDDGSQDNTYKEALKYKSKQVQVYRKDINGGKYTALNFGIEHSSGEIIISTDADNLTISPDALKKMVYYFQDDSVMCVAPSMSISNPKGILNRIQQVEYLLGVFILWRNAYFSVSDYSIFWFCDFAPFVLAIAFIWRKDDLIKGVVNLGFFPQIIFLFGAFMMFFFNVDVFGIGLNLKHLNLWFVATSVVLHVSLVASYFLNYKVKPTYKCLVYSLVLLIAMYFIAISQTPIDENVNYVFIFDKIGFDGITYMYIPLAFFVVVFPSFMFQSFMYRLWKFNSRHKNK